MGHPGLGSHCNFFFGLEYHALKIATMSFKLPCGVAHVDENEGFPYNQFKLKNSYLVVNAPVSVRPSDNWSPGCHRDCSLRETLHQSHPSNVLHAYASLVSPEDMY